MVGQTLSSILLVLGGAAPAAAQSASAVVPEPSGLVLFGMGMAGLVIGRALARRKPGE